MARRTFDSASKKLQRQFYNKLYTPTGLIVAGVVLVALIITYLSVSWGYTNEDVDLRNAATAQQTELKNFFDTTWKIIQQKTQVSNAYRDDFKEIYPKIIGGRYNGDATLLKFVKEANPELNPAVYRDLSTAVEAQRLAFAREQKKLISIKQQHDNLRNKKPSKWFVKSDELKIQIITSNKTEDVFESGKDNDMDLGL